MDDERCVRPMTYEEKCKFLYQYLDAKREMQAYMKDLEFWRSVGESMSPSGGRGSGSVGSSKVENASVHIADLERDIVKSIPLCQEKQKKVVNVLERMETGEYKAILCDIYIAGKSKLQAANDRGISERSIYRKHKKAVNMLHM